MARRSCAAFLSAWLSVSLSLASYAAGTHAVGQGHRTDNEDEDDVGARPLLTRRRMRQVACRLPSMPACDYLAHTLMLLDEETSGNETSIVH